jgi:subtilisin
MKFSFGQPMLFAALFSMLMPAVVPVVAAKSTTDTIQTLQNNQERYIVLLNDTAAPADIARDYAVDLLKTIQNQQKGIVATVHTDILERLKKDPRVRLVEPDFVVTTTQRVDPASFTFPFPTKYPFPFPFPFPFSSSSSSSFSSSSKSSIPSSTSSSSRSSQQSSAPVNSSQVIPAGIARIHDMQSPTAAIGQGKSVNTDIAILDSGIDLTHPDLNVVHHINMITNCALDSGNCGNDDNGHGTHVAGTTAARDNTFGVVGVAPGARLWAVKVLDQNGSGYMSDIIEGINFIGAHSNEIGTVNMSFGCGCQSAALNEAINAASAKGVVFVAAAGNSKTDTSNFSPTNNPNVITVSAMTDTDGKGGATGANPTCRTGEYDDRFASFSNYGSVVAVSAPGVCIRSTWKDGGYNTISGTSMAAPHVTGAVALYIASHGKPQSSSDVANVKRAIISAASAQSGQEGFNGDPDGSHEPLLNVGSW